jgi:hypothetical protein
MPTAPSVTKASRRGSTQGSSVSESAGTGGSFARNAASTSSAVGLGGSEVRIVLKASR